MIEYDPPNPGAQYQCVKCQYEWTADAGPQGCPICHHDYVVWLNYDGMFPDGVDIGETDYDFD